MSEHLCESVGGGLAVAQEREPSRLFCVEEEGDGAVVGEADLHVGAEAAGFDRDAAAAEVGGDGFVERDGFFGPGGVDERRAIAFSRVAEEGELRYEQDRAFHVLDGEVELAVGIAEDSELRDLLRDVCGVVFGVVQADAE